MESAAIIILVILALGMAIRMFYLEYYVKQLNHQQTGTNGRLDLILKELEQLNRNVRQQDQSSTTKGTEQ